MRNTLHIKSTTLNNITRRQLLIAMPLLALLLGFGNCSFGQTFYYTGGLQSYTVPDGATVINIQANGAQGGSTIANSFPATSATAGGLGAVMSGIFSVTPGHVLSILVGQQPAAVLSGAGGGGGTFVWDVTAGNVLLIAAGGGGGAIAEQSITPFSYTGINAVTTNNGTGGGGGTGGAGVTGHGATSVNAPSNSWAGGGAGWLSSGAAGHSTVGSPPVNAGGGINPLDGGAGGSYGGRSTNNSNGGYGGGGGGQGNAVFFGGGGGGGGYSGGAGGAQAGAYDIEPGGGGGSYNSGSDQNNSVGNTGNGKVIMTVHVFFVPTVSGPSLPSSSRNLAVCYNSTSNSIDSVLAIHDITPGQTETWTVASGPSHGALGGFNATGISTSDNISPSGLTYTPTTGYSGTDAFMVQISDGSYMSMTTVHVTVNALPTVSAGGDQIVCASGSSTNGTITLSPTPSSGGIWTATAGSFSGNVYSDATPGYATVTYTYTDENGCTNSSSAAVTVNALPTPAFTITNTSCNTGNTGIHNNGSLVAVADDGAGSYTYLWSNSVTGGTNTGLAVGCYSVTVTDANSCTTTGSAIVGQPALLAVVLTPTSPSCNSANGGTHNNGSISTSVTGGTSAYSYLWSNARTGASNTGLTASTTLTVTVTDAHSCTTTGSATVTAPASFSATITGPTSVLDGDPATFTAPAGYAAYSWTPNVGGYTIGNTSSQALVFSATCSATYYRLTLVIVDSRSCTAVTTETVTTTPTTPVSIYSSLYTTGTGQHPTTTKTALLENIKVFDRTVVGTRDYSQSHYSSVWNSTTGQVTNVAITGPTTVTFGGGPADRYIVSVPPGGKYLIVGQATVPSPTCDGSNCTIYMGTKVGGYDAVDGSDYTDTGSDATCTAITRLNAAMKNANGVVSEGVTQEQTGSLMLVVTPATLSFTDSTQLLPVIYESVEGTWEVSASAEPPYGFYATPSDSLSTMVVDTISDSALRAVQFTITDTGSEWTNTQITHHIMHKGAPRVAYSAPKMVNNRTNKPSTLTIIPNPAVDEVNIMLNAFEGEATIYIYNVLGQKVAEKPIKIMDGESVQMNISSLPSGVYLVTAKNASGKATGRLIKTGK